MMMKLSTENLNMKYHIMLALRAVTDEQLAEVAVRLADVPEVTSTFEHILLEVMAGNAVAASDTSKFEIPHTGGYVHLTKTQMHELRDTATAGNKVAGVKLIRNTTGLSLKEAKDLWEWMEMNGIIKYNRDVGGCRLIYQ